MILVTSGAVNSGRFQLRKAAIMGASFHQQLSQSGPETSSSVYSSACASAGQLGSIYATLFAHCDVSVSQYLVTSYDFTDDARKQHLSDSIDLILAHGMVPILNENDAVCEHAHTLSMTYVEIMQRKLRCQRSGAPKKKYIVLALEALLRHLFDALT